MLKRKILAAVLPVVAAGTVVGSGFSAWYFNENTAGGEPLSVGIEIAPATNQAGNLSVKYNGSLDSVTGAKVMLDQGTGNNRNNYLKGISFTSNETPLQTGSSGAVSGGLQTIDFTYKIGKTDFDTLDKANMSVKITLEVTLNETFAQYIDVSSAKDTTNTSNYAWCPDVALTENSRTNYAGTFDFNSCKAVNGDYYEFTFRIDLTTNNEVNTMLSYYQNSASGEGIETTFAKPSNFTDWNTMNTTLSKLNDVINFKASVAISEKE